MRRFTHLFVTALLVLFSASVLWAAPPTTQAKYLGFSNITSSGAKATWINGNGLGRLVVISTDNTWETITDYASSDFSSTNGTVTNQMQLGTSNDYVIGFTTGTTRVLNLSELSSNTTYYVRIYEYNGTHGSYQFSTATGTNNPRSFTTLAGLSAPTTLTITTDATAQNSNTFPVTWSTVTGATGYKFDVDDNNDFSSPLSEYTDIDVGNTTSWELYLPIAGTYYVRVKAYNSSENSPYNSTSFAVTASMPPKFLAGDAPTLTEKASPNYGFFDITLTFDQPVYANNDGTGDLTTSDFAVAAPSSGDNASGKVVITAVSHSAGSNTAVVTVQFNDRVTTSEKFRIAPANNTSIYSAVIAPASAGVPMDVALQTTKGGQYSADITCPDLSVLNTTDNIAFGTIQKAIDATTTGVNETIQLKDGTTYSENVTVNKAVTLTDQGVTNATVTGTWTLGGSSDVDLSTGSITISGLVFDLSNVTNSIVVGNVYNGTVSIQGNTFYLYSSKNAISVQSNRTTGPLTNLNIGDSSANTFSGTAGTSIYFNNDGTGTNGITNVLVQQNTFPVSGASAIEFENVDLTSLLPPINLGSGNTNTDGMLITDKYVYSHSTLNASTYLYPGIAVLGTTTTLDDGTATAYNTVADAIAASADNGTQTVFLGKGTYTEAIALNEAVSLKGKGQTSTGTVLTNTLTVSGTAAGYSIQSIYFDVQNTNGIVVSATPTSTGQLDIQNNHFELGANEVGINITDNTLSTNFPIYQCYFNFSDATATGIKLPNNQITTPAIFEVGSNTFSGTAAGTGVYISTTNSTGASTGEIRIRGNSFSSNVGDAIVFEDAVSNSNSLSGATINIYNANYFNQSGYGIKINDVGTYSGFIGTTLPNTIDLYDTVANTNFTAADIYGGAWYDLTGSSAVLYPSIQTAENANTSATLYIGAGTYNENVTIDGATITTVTGNGTTCELVTGKDLTLGKDLTISGFSANTVVLVTGGQMSDAIVAVKTNGTININGSTTISDNATINKAVAITESAASGAYSGTLTIATGGVAVSALDLTGNPAINIAPTDGITSQIGIVNNTFTLANGGSGIVVETGNASSAGTAALNITGNSFTGGNATSKAINFRNQTTGFANFTSVNVYDGNTFNTTGYNFYKTQENNICTYLPSVDVKNSTDNTYTTTNIYGFYLNPSAATISISTESLVTDCTAPAAFTTGSVTTTTNAVAGWWNGDNSAVNIQVPIANDASLAYGTVQIIASRDNWTNTLNLGSAQTINPADLNTTKTYTFNQATFEALTGFTEGDLWKFNATITDFAGNSTTGTPSSSTLTVDRVDPTATLNSATADNIINISEKTAGFNVNAEANENNTTLYVVNVIDNTPTYSNIATVGFASAIAPTAGTSVNIAVSANNTNIIDGKTYRVFAMDQAGNLSSASATAFTTDLTAPAGFTVGTVSVPSGAKAGYYNKADHDADRSVEVVVPVANDASLTGGTIQVRAKRGVGGTYENVGSAHTITGGNLGNNVTITLTKVQFEGITDLTEGDQVYFTAVITDLAGNSTTGTQSANTLIFDIVPPTATTIASRTAVTAPIVANYFNASNTAVDVVINIPNDSTLVGGNVKLQASADSNSFVDVAVTTNAIANGDLGATKTITVAKTGTANTDLQELTGWESGVTLDFRAVLEDAAGNSTYGTTYTPTMNVDLYAPDTFTTDAVVTTGGNVVANYWNSTNTGLNVTVPVDNDGSLTGGTIQVQASKDGGTNWLNLGSAYTIVGGDLNTNKTLSFTDAVFEGLSGFAEGNVWNFRAVITDIAGNVTNGGQSGTSITVDQTAPTATLVSATPDNVINIAEKAAGFNVVAQSNEATGTLYVVDVTTNPTNTYSNIGTNGFATATVSAANTNINVAVSAANANIITGSTYKVYTMDAAGNLSAASTGSFTTDLVAPTITSITSTTTDGLYGIGSDINFTINLDEAATFTANSGNLSLPMALDAGAGNAIRNTDAASSTTLSLTYTVANGHSAADLTHGAGPAVLNGGATWTDAAGNPVVLTLPDANTFKSARAIQIDGVPPTFTVEYHLNSVTGPSLGVNPTIGIGNNYYIKITASEELTSAPTISIAGLDSVTSTNNNVTNASTFVHVANTQFSYNRVVVETNDNGTDELITITGTDLAGNTATNAIPTNAYTAVAAASGYQAKVDGKRPEPVITLAVVDYNDGTNDWTNNNPIAATVNYGEPVQNVTNTVISVTNGTKSNFVNTANTTFTVDVTPSPTTQGTLVTVSVPEGNISNQIKDAGGNFAYGATKSIKYDGTAPTTTDNVPSGWQNSNITITFTPDDASGSGAAKVYYTTDGTTPTTSSSYVTSTYQFTISTDGTYTIKYFAVDKVENAETVKTATNQAKLDKTAPTIAANTITAPTSATKWNGGNHNITWTTTNITDATSGLTTTPISLYYSTNASDPSPTWTLIADNLSNSGSYTWDVPNTINSTDVQVRIDAVDNAGNVASQVSQTFTIDNTPPTATITITPNNSPLNGYAINNATTSINLVIDFSEPMDPSSTITIDITNFSSILTAGAGAWSNGNQKYTKTYTVSNTSPISITNGQVDVSGAKDIAQNTMTPAQLTNVKVDQVLPTVTSLTPGKSVYNKSDGGTTTTFQVVFSEAMVTTNTPVLDFNGTNLSGVFTYTSQAWSGGNTTYTASDNVTDDNATSNYAVRLRYASGATDLAGNAPAQTLDDATFAVDMVAPTIAFRNAYQSTSFNTNTTDKYAKAWETVYFEFTASELLPTNYLDAPCGEAEFSGEGGTNYSQQDVSGTQVYYIWKGGSELVSTPDGVLTYKVKFVDAAGNCSNQLIGNSGVIFDKTLPVISNIQINGHNDGNVWLNSAGTGTITFNLTEQNPTQPTVSLYQSDGTTALNVATATYSGVSGTAPNFTYTYTVTGLIGDFNNCVIKVNETDLAGNIATTGSLSPAFNVDNTVPTLPTVTIASNNAVTPGDGTNAGFAKVGDNVTLNITASESLQSLSGTIAGTAGTASGSGTSWTLARAMTGSDADGLVTFSINFTDLAGNVGTAVTAVTNTSSITFDKTNPVISITAPAANACINGTQTLTWTLTETNASANTQAKIASGTLSNFTSGTAISSLDGWSGATEGTQTITVQHTDKAGNVGTATVDINKDVTAPTISSITLGNVTLGDNTAKITTDNSVTFTVTFSEPVYNFDASDITLNKTGTINTPDIAVSGSGSSYTVTVGGTTNITGDGTLGITVNTSNIIDCASNALSAPMTSGTFTIDNTPPTVYNVENNCDGTPISGYTYNQAARITFSEGVYTNNNASGALTGSDLSISASSGNATLQGWGFLSHTAGGTQAAITTSWNGTVLGSEKLRADAFNATSIYDQAGNAMAVAGSDVGGPSAPKNWDYAKAQIVILTQPTDQSTCETGTAQFTTSAQGGLSVTYQWQYYNGTNWVNLTNTTINGATFSNVTTSQVTITNPNSTNWNGKQFRCLVTNDCGNLATNTVTLTVNPNTSITTQPSNAVACYSSVNNDFTVVAGGQPPVGYQWQYSADNSTWNNVANGTPTNATYSGNTSATLNVQGNIATGTYYYRVIVSSACGPNVTSNSATLIVNPLPSAGLTVGGTGTICEGSSTNITVALSETGVSYQLRIGTTPVDSSVSGNGSTISLPTGTLTSTTTFNVLATNTTTSCSVQLTNTATVTVEATPVNPTLATATPASSSTVCQGSTVSATFTAGSGGNGTDSYEYSLDNGSSWAAYTPGNNLTVGTQTVLIRGKRNATVCATSWTTLATWNVELTPVAAPLTKQPNTDAVCSGETVRAAWINHGTGGNGTYTYEYRTSTNNGTNWTSWATYTYSQDGSYYGSDINTEGLTNVEIRATRNADYCSPATTIVSWSVDPLPTASISGTTPACVSTVLTATTSASSPTYQWKKDGNNVGTNSSTYTATASGSYTVVVTDGVTLCSNESSAYVVTIDVMPTVYNVTGGPFCAGSNISLNLSGSETGITYNVKLGGSTVASATGTGSAISITVNSAAAGTYTIEAVNGTCTQAMSGSVTVNPAPTANASADAYTCGTTAYTLSGTSATNYSSILWTHNGAGSLTNATTLTPTYTPVAGDIGNNVTLTLTVTALAGCVNVQDQMVLTVTPQATANAGSDASICEGGTFTVSTASATNYISLNWTSNGTGSFTNGTTLTPTYIPGIGETGTVTLTLTATGQNGCNATDNMVLTINANPTITTNAVNQTRCGTGNVTFNAATTGLNNVIDWSASNTFASYTTGDSYTVSVTAGNTDTYYYRARNTVTGCVSGTLSVTGTAYTLPTPTISGSNTVAINTDLTLTTQSGMSGYVWSVDGGTITSGSGTYQIAVQWSSAGTKNVTVQYTDANGCSGTSSTFQVTVNASQAPVITGNPSNTTKCSNETNATFSVTSVTGTPTPTLQWQVSTDGGSNWNSATGTDYSNDNTTTLTVSNLSGKNAYQYRLYATNGVNPDAYSSAATLTVTTAVTPSVSIVSSDVDNTFCSGTSVTFTATVNNTGGGTVSYQWKLNGNNVGTNQNTYTTTSLVNNDAVSCVITITGGCVTTTTATSNTITNTVNTVPAQPSAISGNTTVCAGTNGVAYSVTNVSDVTYTWSYSGNNVTIASGQGTNSITLNFASNATSGTLTVTPSNGCGNGTAQTLAITVPGAISYSVHPSNVSVAEGANTSFSATVSNATSYQWQVSTDNGNNWSNATGGVYSNETTTTLNINGVTAGMNGYQYRLLSSSTCETNIPSNAATLSVMASEPTTQASSIVRVTWNSDFIQISWTNGNGSKRLVLAKTGTSLTETPSDGQTYSSDSSYTAAPSIGGAKVVYNGTGNSVKVINLNSGTNYTFRVFEYNGSGAGTNYNTATAFNNPKYFKTSTKTAANDLTVTIGEHFLLTAISPNPVTSEVNFNIVSKEELPFTIEVYNLRGDLVYSTTAKLSAGDHPFNLKLQSEKGGIPAGTYFLKVTAGDEALQQKFIYQP